MLDSLMSECCNVIEVVCLSLLGNTLVSVKLTTSAWSTTSVMTSLSVETALH